MNKTLLLLLFFIALPVAAESTYCPPLKEIQNAFNEANNHLSAYIVADFKGSNKNPWSLKPIEFKSEELVWKLGVGPIDANSEGEAINSAKELILKSNTLKERPDVEPNYNHAWCYYTDKNAKPLVFAITPLKAMG